MEDKTSRPLQADTETNKEHWLTINGTQFYLPGLKDYNKKQFKESFKHIPHLDLDNTWIRIERALKALGMQPKKVIPSKTLTSINGNENERNRTAGKERGEA